MRSCRVTTFRRSTKGTRHNKHFVSTYWPNFQVPFHTFYVSTEDFPMCCRSPISLSSPRKSTTGKNVRSISFFVEEEVQEKLRKQSLCFVKTLETKQIQHCFSRINFPETCNNALLADFAKRTHHSTAFFIIPAITDNVHGDC